MAPNNHGCQKLRGGEGVFAGNYNNPEIMRKEVISEVLLRTRKAALSLPESCALPLPRALSSFPGVLLGWWHKAGGWWSPGERLCGCPWCCLLWGRGHRGQMENCPLGECGWPLSKLGDAGLCLEGSASRAGFQAPSAPEMCSEESVSYLHLDLNLPPYFVS